MKKFWAPEAVRRARGAAGLVLCVVASGCAPFVVPSPDAAPETLTPRCAEPTDGDDFERRSPAQAGVNPAILNYAMGAADNPLTSSFRVYRHNCLIAESVRDVDTAHVAQPLFSLTKSIVALGVGRAETLGLISLDDPIESYFPEADAEHGAITVRQLLTQTSGLRFAWANDLLASTEDSIDELLQRPFVAEPGTKFQYAQTSVNLLTELVGRASGRDFQRFMSEELFEPIGITPGSWSWMRDAVGVTQGYAWLDMAPRDVAKLATLTLQHGRWGTTSLIDPAYVAEMGQPTATNGGYGFLTLTNRGPWFIGTFFGVPEQYHYVQSAPADTLIFQGSLDQNAFVVPSLDLVIVRTGFLMDSSWKDELFRRLMPAFPDVEPADHGPRRADIELSPTIEDLIDIEVVLRRLAANGG